MEVAGLRVLQRGQRRGQCLSRRAREQARRGYRGRRRHLFQSVRLHVPRGQQCRRRRPAVREPPGGGRLLLRNLLAQRQGNARQRRDARERSADHARRRREELEDLRPPFHGENPVGSGLPTTNNDFILHPARPDVVGDRDVTSAYAEIVVPVVTADRAVPFVHTFEISASGRFEHYSDFGDVTKPKVGANWRPVPWLMLRGSYNEGFMAPSLAALYTSPRWSISTAGTNDPYRNGAIGEGAYTMRNYFGGNPNLAPQESEGTTFGFVLDVPHVEGLSVTADYWSVKRDNLLGQRGVNDILANDAALLRAFAASQRAAGVAPGAINAGAG
ncbi:TonB-dependent receptor, partial [bacterium]